MQMDHAWHTRVTVSCITVTAIFEAAEEALSHSPHLAESLAKIGWLHYIPLFLLIVAGVFWIWGRIRKPKKITNSKLEKIVKDLKLAGGKAYVLCLMEACAIELQSQLEALWHHWDNAGEKLIHPLNGVDKLKHNILEGPYLQLLDERRDFMVLYSHHIGRMKVDLPDFSSAVITTGYPSDCEYHLVLSNLKEHIEKLSKESANAWNKP